MNRKNQFNGEQVHVAIAGALYDSKGSEREPLIRELDRALHDYLHRYGTEHPGVDLDWYRDSKHTVVGWHQLLNHPTPDKPKAELLELLRELVHGSKNSDV